MSVATRSSVILLSATLLGALGWIFSKETISALPPFAFVGLRFICAAILLLPFCFSTVKNLNKLNILQIAAVGFFLGLTLLSWIFAISLSQSLGEGAFITSMSMLFVPLVGWILFRQAPPRSFWLALPIAVIGLAILSLAGKAWSFNPSQFWFLLSAVSLAVHFNLNSKFAAQIPALSLTCIQLFVVGIMASSLSLLTETWPNQIETKIWGWFTLSVLLATSLRYLMQTLGQKSINPTNAALIMLMEPIWTMIMSVLWYQEQMPLPKIIGCLLILLALLIYRLSPFVMSKALLRLNKNGNNS